MNGNPTNDEKPDRFALGHGHRWDAVYDRPACQQKAYRARRAAERIHEAVTAPAGVTAPVPLSGGLTSAGA
ncbi:hypothetical protein [Streptomyces shenzhenensis]|uniref:hypothetical protein n=1 Tax=Streptomyces shenzhenensis TaxID=943815 RepID=UPI0015F0045F|nr:hypothetical protein [Streptomyces shenzhenensis]